MNNFRFEYISSKQNEKVKTFAKLASAKYRDEAGMFLAEGVKLASEAVDAGCAEYLLVRESSAETSEIRKVLDKSEDSVIKYILTDPVFDKVTTESAPQGIIAVSRCLAIHTAGDVCSPSSLEGKRVAALDGIRDPGNLGTIMRSAAAFGYDALLLHDCADLYNPKTVRASMGALFKVPTVECSDLASYLKGFSGRRILGAALTLDAVDLISLELSASDVTVIGNEGHGISDGVMSACTSFVKIPITDKAESLNAATAASVIMWEYSKIGK